MRDLQKRSEEIQTELEEDNDNGEFGHERYIEHQQLLDEFELLQTRLEELSKQSRSMHEHFNPIMHRDRIEEGDTVLLSNSTYCIRFQLVDWTEPYSISQISVSSPLGRAVFGKRIGDSVQVRTPHGVKHYTVIGIR